MPILQHGQCHRHSVFVMWREATRLVARTRGANSKFVPVAFRLHPFSAQLEMRPRNLRGNVHGQSTAQQQHGKAKNHFQNPVTKVSKSEMPNRVRSAAQLRKDEAWTQSIAKVIVTKSEHEPIVQSGDHLATTQIKADPKYQRTEAGREALLRWLVDRKRRHIGTRRRSQQEPKILYCFSADKGTFSRYGNLPC